MGAQQRALIPWVASALLLAVIGTLWFAYPPNATRAQAQGEPQGIVRLKGTPHPDLSGVWQAVNEANWDLEGHAARAARLLTPGVRGGFAVPAAPVLALG